MRDLTNKNFGFFKIVKLFESTNKICHDRYWWCKCICGTEKKVRQTHLTNGRVKSCGCQQFQKGKHHPSWTGHEEMPGTFFKTIKHGAKTRKLEFKITKEKIWNFFLLQNRKCALTGIELKFNSGHNKTDGNASLDRIDSKKGYTLDNVQWVHKDINIMKMDMTNEQLFKYCKRICEYNKL
jgi:hypothetical protein